MKKSVFIVLCMLCCLFMYCTAQQSYSSEEIDITDIRLFNQTPAWELVKAIEKDDSKKIKEILHKNPNLLNYQEPVYGMSPIRRAVGRRKYAATKTLIECGVNLNLHSKDGEAPIFDAMSYRWDEGPTIDDSMLKILLKSGADPNIIYDYKENKDGYVNVIEYGTTPLMYAIAYSSGYNLVKTLVEYGAKIDAKTPLGTTAAIEALRSEDIQSAYYLIVSKNASITEPYYNYEFGTSEIDSKNPFFPVDLLLYLTYPLDSKEYLMKKAIINKFGEHGINYQERKSKIPGTVLEQIKKIYPETWKEYVAKY